MFVRCGYAWVGLALLGWMCLPGNRTFAQQTEPDEASVEPAAVGLELAIDQGALEAAAQQGIRLLQGAESEASTWVGLALAPADETLRAQLGLDEGVGVVVTAVVDESPAFKAGVKKHDILLSVADAPVAEAADVVKAVEAAGEKPITLNVLRGGEETELEVTPEKRRPAERVEIEIGGKDGLVVRNLAQYLVRPGAIVQTPLQVTEGRLARARLHLAGVGNLPENLTVSITKTGAEPAQIVVKRNDEKWELTEDQLDELPEDVRRHVDGLLGRPPRIRLHLGHAPRREAVRLHRESLGERRESRRQRVRERSTKISPRRAGKSAGQQQLDALSRQVEQLQRTIEELRRNLPEDQEGSDEER